jgi:hypothetical protein
MPAPGPLAWRDLVQQVAVGFVVLALALFFSWHLWPAGWAGLLQSLGGPAPRAACGGAALLLLPAWLALLYVLGAVVPNPYGMLAPRRSLLGRGMVAARILSPQAASGAALLRPQGSATQRWRAERIAGSFGLRLEELTPEELEDLFRLMVAREMSREASLAQVDIERHFALVHFNARLSMLFFLSFAGCLAGLLGRLAALVLPLPWDCGGGAPAVLLALLAAGSYAAAFTCGRRAQGIHRQWHRLVVDAFVARDGPEA